MIFYREDIVDTSTNHEVTFGSLTMDESRMKLTRRRIAWREAWYYKDIIIETLWGSLSL